jgi:hypothetical protein
MASTTQDELLKSFTTAAGFQIPDWNPIVTAGEQLATSLTAAAKQASELEKQSKSTGSQNAASTSGEGGGIGSTLVSIGSSVFKTGLGLAPLVSGLFGLFGGGGSPDPPPLTKYALPPSMAFAGAYSRTETSDVDYDQAGMPRAFRATETGYGTSAPVLATPNAPGGDVHAAAPQITVQVQAMDAQSFLDRSSDIARAVKDAMLNLNSINDVISDL